MTRAPKAASASEGEAAPFKRQLRVDDIGNGEEGAIQASPAECHAIAQMLDLVAVERLDFTYLCRQAGAQIALKGRPLPLIEELNHQAEDKGHPLREWPEPILEGKMDIGSVIYETFATALDPYPKRQGASLQWQESDAQSDDKEKPEGPFAALAQLKQR